MRRVRRRLLAVVARGALPRRARGGRARARRLEPRASASRPLVLILAMAALSLIPFALLMVTSFVRISVVLSILRSAIGTPSVPPTQVLTGLSLILTIAVMAPTGQRMYDAMKPALGMAAGRRRRQRRDGGGAAARPPTAARSRCATSSSSTPIRATARRSSP